MAVPMQANPLVKAGLETRIVLPENPEYGKRNDSYYDNSARVNPACFLQPQTAQEVAVAIKALADADQAFAIRSGGHGNQAGVNNIKGGVTIDLCLLNSIQYDAATEVAHIGPGADWEQVYNELEKHNRVAGGGRVASVGVGGYLLGGGISFQSAREGFACDNVVAYEIVLADGSIITASAKQNQDLFLVLKGGGNNFGVVTSFTIKTHAIRSPLWGARAFKSADCAPAAAEALQEFTANVAGDPDNSVIYAVANMAALGGDAALVTTVNVAGKENPEIFKKFAQLPDSFNEVKSGNIQELLPFSDLPPDFFNVWYTLTFKNDTDIISKTSDLLFELSKELQAEFEAGDFATYCAFQPLPRVFAQRSVTAGGNVMGLENYPHDAILLQAAISVKTQEQADKARPKVEGLIDKVREFAGEDRICPWLYLNYCHSDQKPLESYGPENVQKIRDAAAKYDPNGVFQKLCPGGFKISAVQT